MTLNFKILIFVSFILTRVQSQYLQSNRCPEPHGEQTYFHPEFCDQFILCVNGTLSVEQCENGLLFDNKGNVHNHCNYYHEVDCGQRKANLIPISSPGCEFKYGIYAAGSGCNTNFIKCTDGVPSLQPCEPGLAYDEKIKKCNWPDELLNICNPEDIVGFKCPENVDPDSPQARFWPYPRYAIPNDCERLITCVNGHPRLITCGDEKLFDDESLTCLEPEQVPKCSNSKRKFQ